MKAVISGYYGFGNLGDEAVLQSLIVELRKRDPQLAITVIAGNPGKIATIEQVKAIGRANWLATVTEIKGADLLISGGGSLFQDVTSSRSLYYYLAIIFLAKLLRKKVMILAQGIGPLRRRVNQWATKTVLNLVDLLSVRDEYSLAELRRLGIRKRIELAADPAVLMTAPDRSEGERLLQLEGVELKKNLIGVALRPASFSQTEMAAVLDDIARKNNSQMIFLIFQPSVDLPLANRVAGLMKERPLIFFQQCQPAEMLAVIARLDLLIGIRLHSLIMAAVAGVPLVGLAYDPKVSAFLQQINQPPLSLTELDKLPPTVKRLLQQKEWLKRSMEAAVNDQREKARQLLDLLLALLKK